MAGLRPLPILVRRWVFGDLITARGGNGVVLMVLYSDRVICLDPKSTEWSFGMSATIAKEDWKDWRKVDATTRTS